MCSKWRNGRCAVRFSGFAPWGDYRVLYTDHTSLAIVYSCSRLFMGMLTTDYVWLLTRDLIPVGTLEHSKMIQRASEILAEKVPNYDTD